MPIEHYIDHDRQIVVARGVDPFTDTEIFAYQKEVWTRAELVGYDELVDMTQVTQIILNSTSPGPDMQRLASQSALSDSPDSPSRFAIVAPDHLAFGMGRMYQTYRALEPKSRKLVGVFRTLPEALAFLGIESLPEPQG